MVVPQPPPESSPEYSVLRNQYEKLSAKLRANREKARAALLLAEKTASDNARQISGAKLKIESLQRLLDAANAERDEALKAAGSSQELQFLKSEVSRLRKERDDAMKQSVTNHDEVRELKAQVRNLIQERDESRTLYTERLQSLQAAVKEASQERDEARSNFSSAKQIKDLQAEVEHLRQELKCAKAAYSSHPKVRDLEASVRTLTQEREDARKELTHLRQSISRCLNPRGSVPSEAVSVFPSPELSSSAPDPASESQQPDVSVVELGQASPQNLPQVSQASDFESKVEDEEDVLNDSTAMMFDDALSEAPVTSSAWPPHLRLGRPAMEMPPIKKPRKRTLTTPEIAGALRCLPLPRTQDERLAILRGEASLSVAEAGDLFAGCIDGHIVSRANLALEVAECLVSVSNREANDEAAYEHVSLVVERIANVVSHAARRDEQVSAVHWTSNTSLPGKLFQQIQDMISKQPQTQPLSTARHLTFATCFAHICRSVRDYNRIRAIVFDVIRLRECAETEFLSAILMPIPQALNVDDECLLGSAILMALACTFVNVENESFGKLKNILGHPVLYEDSDELQVRIKSLLSTSFEILSSSKISPAMTSEKLMLSDLEVNAARALEIISLSQGWPWTCAHVIQPLWQLTEHAGDDLACGVLIYTIGLICRTALSKLGTSPSCPYFKACFVRLETLLHPNRGVSVPLPVQFAAASALVLLAGSQVLQVRSLYKWFVSVPSEHRIHMPPALRLDMQFLGRRMALRSTS